MRLEYASRGLIGVLTPQANTTVEAEMSILLPPGFGFVNARLTSARSTIEERLVDYYDGLEAALGQFANAPLGAIAVGCTGSSYLVGRDREAELAARWSARAGCPVITSALAVVDALNAIGARRIALVSCYPPALTEASSAYWQSHGFGIGEIATSFNAESGFHPIYSLSGCDAAEALSDLGQQDHDAILMLGTGMPTLRPLAEAADMPGPPTLSCMLCLAWRCVRQVEGAPSDAGSVAAWSRGEGWSERLTARFP